MRSIHRCGRPDNYRGHRPLLLLLVSCLLALQSCDVIKKTFRKKESTKTETEEESISSRRMKLNDYWTLNQGNLFHRNGQLWIEMDSLAAIDLTPTGMRIVGYNPIIHGQITTTKKDSTIATGVSQLSASEDSTGRKKAENENKSSQSESEKEQKTQKLAPIIVLSIILIIALLYGGKKLNVF